MKSIIITAIAVILFIPSVVFAQSSIQNDIYLPNFPWIKQVEDYWHDLKISNEEYFNFLTYTNYKKIISEDYFYQELSDVMLNEKIITKNPELSGKILSRNTITYSYEIPLYADENVVYSAIESAFNTWEMLNPKLNYERVDSDGDIQLQFDKNVLDDILGYAMLYCYNDCIIHVSLGAFDCNSKWSHITKDSLRNTMMHEIGHTLGLVHSQDSQNLMYSYGIQTDDDFHDLGYRIPQNLQSETYTIGEVKIIADIDSAHDRIEKALKGFGLTVDGYFNGNQRSTDPSFDNKLIPLIDEYNALINKIDCQYAQQEYKINQYAFLR